MINIYYSPEKFDLTEIGEVDKDEDYGFDKVVLWKSSVDKFYVAQDSGCSCPAPFEDLTSVEDLTQINTLDELTTWLSGYDQMDCATLIERAYNAGLGR